MKVYICRRGRPDFVCNAPTIGEGIVMFWAATQEVPKASYRVHHGRRLQSRVVSAAIGYWVLTSKMRPLLRNVIEEECTTSQYNEFCNKVVIAAELLDR